MATSADGGNAIYPLLFTPGHASVPNSGQRAFMATLPQISSQIKGWGGLPPMEQGDRWNSAPAHKRSRSPGVAGCTSRPMSAKQHPSATGSTKVGIIHHLPAGSSMSAPLLRPSSATSPSGRLVRSKCSVALPSPTVGSCSSAGLSSNSIPSTCVAHAAAGAYSAHCSAPALHSTSACLFAQPADMPLSDANCMPLEIREGSFHSTASFSGPPAPAPAPAAVTFSSPLASQETFRSSALQTLDQELEYLLQLKRELTAQAAAAIPGSPAAAAVENAAIVHETVLQQALFTRASAAGSGHSSPSACPGSPSVTAAVPPASMSALDLTAAMPGAWVKCDDPVVAGPGPCRASPATAATAAASQAQAAYVSGKLQQLLLAQEMQLQLRQELMYLLPSVSLDGPDLASVLGAGPGPTTCLLPFPA